jgi:hypothetical protein
VLLVGIVGMRVEVLKLGSSVGTEMQQASILQSANAVLQSQVSALSDSRRIVQQAERRGMTMPLPLDLHFVQASGPASVSRAIADVRGPAPAAFLARLQDERTQDGASVVNAETTSAIGVLGGGVISSGASDSSAASTSSGTGATTTTLTVAPAAAATDTTAAGTAAGTDAPATQTQPSGGTEASQGAASSAPGSADPGTSDTAAATDNVPAVTDSASNGAASLAG